MTASQLSSTIDIFKIGDVVVYPTHGVGMIEAEEEQEIAGNKMSFFVVSPVKHTIKIRVPKITAAKNGLRHLSSKNEMEDVIKILKQKPKAKTGNWPKISQEYQTKINSGNLIRIAEVARDCHEGSSYSEKMFFNEAIVRLATEYALAMDMNEETAEKRIMSILTYKSV